MYLIVLCTGLLINPISGDIRLVTQASRERTDSLIHEMTTATKEDFHVRKVEGCQPSLGEHEEY